MTKNYKDLSVSEKARRRRIAGSMWKARRRVLNERLGKGQKFYTVDMGRNHAYYLVRTGTKATPTLQAAYKRLPPKNKGAEVKRVSRQWWVELVDEKGKGKNDIVVIENKTGDLPKLLGPYIKEN
jgi:hypothetical protein